MNNNLFIQLMIDLNILTIFINEPYNDMNNFNLGYEYELIGQTSIALSYYLRCAEYTSNDNISYECLIRMSKCLSKQGNRDINELTCLEHAISIKPGRSEAYYIMSLYHSYRGNWLKSYMYACIGLENTDLQSTDLQDSNKLIKDIGYYSYNQLLFQKAYSGYNKGKLKESKMIYLNLLKSDINDTYKDIIKGNLTNFTDYNFTDNFYKDPDRIRCNAADLEYGNKTHYDKIGVDIGACIGETIHYFDECDKVYAIEPGKEEFIQLKEKYKNDKRIIPLNYAIAEENGSKSLNCYHNGRFSSFLEFQKEGEFYNFCQENVESFDNLKEKINVETKRLDTFIDENKISEIEFIKIDTQGYDLNVVKSLGKYIDKIKKIQLESQIQTLYKNSPLKDEIISYMNNNNFELIDKDYGEISKNFEEDLIFLNNKFITNHGYNKLDIVLQGKFNENVLHIAAYYLELDFVNNIIVSCWQDDIIPQIHNDRIKIIQSEVPVNPGTGQRNLQIISSLGGIKESTTEFIIKIRNDQRYTHESMINMYKFYEGYKERKLTFYYDEERPRNRICVSGNFSEFSFHPRDHLFWGNREDLIDLFSIPLEIGKVTDKIRFIVPEDYSLYYEYFIRTETYIGAHYLSNFDQKINYYLLDPKKYLYDNSEKYSETLELSDKLTPQIFKSFPREGIDLEWYKYKWKIYPYGNQRNIYGERWHEDGL
tara:strand:+ start:910 stop:3036 length:2127 start_codon:yes stop_codon:yes gene_type:complete